VHLTAQQLKEPGGTDVYTGGGIAIAARLAIDTDVWRFINLETHEIQAFFDWFHRAAYSFVV